MANIKVATAQFNPLHLNSASSIKKMKKLIKKASNKSTNLIVFPELAISMYPNFSEANYDYREKFNKAALTVDGPEMKDLSRTVKDNHITIVTGFIERDSEYPEVLYNSSCVIDSDGTLLGTHRKIAPLNLEMLFFKKGDANDVRVFDTSVGKIGIAMCTEHLNPLYRRALTLLGEEIHCALWVTSQDNKHIVDATAKVTAVEGGAFVLISSQISIKNPNSSVYVKGQKFLGGSGIINPWGNYIAGPIFEKEDILYADVDIEKWRVRKFQSRGVEARDDILSLNITKEPFKPYKDFR
jgi:predicted amidohydrolase